MKYYDFMNPGLDEVDQIGSSQVFLSEDVNPNLVFGTLWIISNHVSVSF